MYLSSRPEYCKTGTVIFFLGILLVMVRWPVLGMIAQVWALLFLFGQFFPIIFQSLQDMPVIGPILRTPALESFFSNYEGGGDQRRAPV